MAKNYDNIAITTSSSDTYNTFEKSYSFVGFYRAIISGNTLDTTERGIDKAGGQVISDLEYEAFNIGEEGIEYVRIRNPHATNALTVKLYNSQHGEEIYLEIQAGEVLQFHSQLKIDNDLDGDGVLNAIDYIEIMAAVDPSAADIFIGFKEA